MGLFEAAEGEDNSRPRGEAVDVLIQRNLFAANDLGGAL